MGRVYERGRALNNDLRLLPTFRGQKKCFFFFIWQNLSQLFYLAFTKEKYKKSQKRAELFRKNVFSNKVNKVIILSTGKTPGEIFAANAHRSYFTLFA